MNQETWKDVVGYRGFYQISNFGRIRSIAVNRKYGKQTGRLINIKPSVIKSGYCYIHLYKNGRQTRKAIALHRLVATAFIPNPYQKQTVNHIDGNKKNNKVKNLEWSTKSENTRHGFRIKLMTSETYSKLSRREVNKIRKFYPRFTQQKLATMFNISQTQINRIINKESWKNEPKRKIT